MTMRYNCSGRSAHGPGRSRAFCWHGVAVSLQKAACHGGATRARSLSDILLVY